MKNEELIKLVEELKERVEKLENPHLIHWAKVRPNAIIPTKRTEDAGFDLYACFYEDLMIIPPHKVILVPTGIASAFDNNIVVKLSERGSTGTKQMAQRCGVIDSGFRGEIKVPISNLNDVPIIISKLVDEDGKPLPIDSLEKNLTCLTKKGECDTITRSRYEELINDEHAIIYPYTKAITQGIAYFIPEIISDEIPYDVLKEIPSERGTGMLGSSKK